MNGCKDHTHHDRSVVDQDIDPTPLLDDALNHPVAALLVSDVLGEEETLSPGSSNELLGLVGVDLLLGKVDDGDLGELADSSITETIAIDREVTRCRMGRISAPLQQWFRSHQHAM